MKKNYSSIGEWVKRNSVSFLVSDGVCMDIKVEPNTEEVDFGDLYGIRLNFDCNKKSFPSVKRLRFGESNELYIKFSNTLFPNVREIVSTNLKYPSGTMLIRKLNDAENLLLNTFCLEEDEPLDLRGITDIDEDALIGCKSNQVIHTEDIVNVSVKAFEKSGLACMKKPFVDGVKMAGTIACDFNKNAEKYIIPNFATAMATFLDYNMDATMIIKCNKAFFRRDMFYSVPNNLSAGLIVRLHSPVCKYSLHSVAILFLISTPYWSNSYSSFKITNCIFNSPFFVYKIYIYNYNMPDFSTHKKKRPHLCSRQIRHYLANFFASSFAYSFVMSSSIAISYTPEYQVENLSPVHM